MDESIKERTRAEWRELGFFYDRDDELKEWRIVGDRTGLLRFASVLREYATDPRNTGKSEHEHYGPYMYLKLMTWPEPGLDGDSVHGPLDHLARLASIVESKVAGLSTGNPARIREEFATTSEYSLVLELRDIGFDPAAEDGNLSRAV